VSLEDMLPDPFDRPTRLAASSLTGLDGHLEPEPEYPSRRPNTIGSSD
jgi:hypothetical protein